MNMAAQVPAEIDQTGVALANSAQETLKQYETLVIENAEQYADSAQSLKNIKSQYTKIDEHRKFLKAGALETCQRIDGFFKQPLNFLTSAETALKKAIVAYQQKLAAQQAKLQREAEEAARQEQERLDAKAEKKAATAESKGNAEKAAEIRAAVPIVPVPTVVVAAPKIAGISTRTRWKWRVSNPKVIPREYMIPNEPMLNKFAEATKGAVPVEGIEFYSEEEIAASRR